MNGAFDSISAWPEASLRPLQGAQLAEQRIRAYGLPRIGLTPREVGDVLTVGMGALPPLRGLPGAEAWRRICTARTLPDGQPCATPPSVSVDRVTADSLLAAEAIGLYDPRRDEVVAILELESWFDADPALEAHALYADAAADHPGRRALRDQGQVLLAGPVHLISAAGLDEDYGAAFRWPAEVRADVRERGWERLVAVDALQVDAQRRVDAALAQAEAVLLMARVGRLVHDDHRGEEAARAMVGLAPRERVLPCVVPMAMRGSAGRDRGTLAQLARSYGATAVW